MSKVIVSDIKVLLDENNVRLGDIIVLLNTIHKVLYKLSDFEKCILDVFFKYVQNYNNILNVSSCDELLSKFEKETSLGNVLEIRLYKEEEDEEIPDVFIKFETYKLFYYNFWPEFVKAIKKGMDLGKEKINFKYRIPKSFINRVYKEYNYPLLKFKNEIVELFRVNEVDMTGSEETEFYLLEVEN